MLKLLFSVCLGVNLLVDSIPLDAPVIQEHIVGGNDTDISKVPYQVGFYAHVFFQCGGSIVSPTHVVTAGHCVDGLRGVNMSIRAGSSSRNKGGVVIKVKEFFKHSKYNRKTLDYDVAVLELETPIEFNNKTIKPIKLISKELSPGSVVLASGWGCTKEGGLISDTLQSVAVPVVERKTCETTYKSHNLTITPRMMCAGADGKDACQGDSGGPLAYKDELVGVVSFGVGCGRKGIPGVYTNIADPEITKFIKYFVKP